MADLAAGVHPGVGTSGHRQVGGGSAAAATVERRSSTPCGPQPRLGGPAGEGRAVVAEVQPRAQGPPPPLSGRDGLRRRRTAQAFGSSLWSASALASIAYRRRRPRPRRPPRFRPPPPRHAPRRRPRSRPRRRRRRPPPSRLRPGRTPPAPRPPGRRLRDLVRRSSGRRSSGRDGRALGAAVGRGAPVAPVGLGHGLLGQRLDQLDHRHRGVVALARADLGDPGVAARAVREARPDLGEQLVHDGLVADRR